MRVLQKLLENVQDVCSRYVLDNVLEKVLVKVLETVVEKVLEKFLVKFLETVVEKVLETVVEKVLENDAGSNARGQAPGQFRRGSGNRAPCPQSSHHPEKLSVTTRSSSCKLLASEKSKEGPAAKHNNNPTPLVVRAETESRVLGPAGCDC